MARKHRAAHVAKVTNTIKGVTYTSYYLRRTFRQDGKVKHETLGNLSDLPIHVIDLISRSLKGETFVPASEAFRITRSLPQGHVEAVLKMIRKLALEDLNASCSPAPSWPIPATGATPHWPRSWASAMPPRTSSTTPWTGCSDGRG